VSSDLGLKSGLGLGGLGLGFRICQEREEAR
jgi:hypothetical protein